MTEQVRHISVILLGVIVAIVAAVVHVCDHELYMIASAIIAGEFGLARTSSNVGVRIDPPVTVAKQETRDQ